MKSSMKLLYLLISTLTIVSIQVTIAQTNGPAQPEYRKFQPIDIKDLVNEFNGAFSYSIPLLTIPGPNGSDFPVILNYRSGSSPNEAASWVGYGWDLNPGAITRNKRGWPDDAKNINVKFLNRTRPNVTASSSITIRGEICSKDKESGEGASSESTEGSSEGSSTSDSSKGSVNASLSYFIRNSFSTLTGFTNQSGIFGGVGGPFLDNCSISASCMWDSRNNYSLSATADFVSYIQNEIYSGLYSKDENMAQSINGTLNKHLPSINFYLEGLSTYSSPNYGFTGMPVVLTHSSGESRAIKPALNLQIGQYKTEIDANVGNWEVSKSKTQDEIIPVYGYMYSDYAESDPNAIMDYSVERDGYYKPNDLYLGIPYSGADNFEVTGADVQGGFRLYQNNVGSFRPNRVKSSTSIWSAGPTLGFVISPFGVNVGVDGSKGTQYIKQEGWNTGLFSFQNKEKYWWLKESSFFRFTNDMGGALVLHDLNASAEEQKKSLLSVDYLNKKFRGDILPQTRFSENYSMKEGLFKNRYDEVSSKKSSDIQYYKFRDYKNKTSDYVNIFFSDTYRKQKLQNIKGVSDDLIAGFSIRGKNGYTYNYGLPVFTRNEIEYNYGLNKPGKNSHDEPVETFYPENSPIPMIVYKQLDSFNEKDRVVTGKELIDPYVSQYLITESFSPDYVDLTNDGPTPDDLGGYVKYNYRRATIKSISEIDEIILNKNQPINNVPSDANLYQQQHENWYKWRLPFNGLSFHKNSISDAQDDMGSVTAGETEIYYLESIETKSHIAYFITNKTRINVNRSGFQIELSGSQNERQDGYSASYNEYEATGKTMAGMPQQGQENLLQYLERIELYSKEIKDPSEIYDPSAPAKLADLIQTVYFQYDSLYSIWPGQPNSVNNVGKLTLARLWSEQGEVKDYTISPYQFGYEYKNFNYPKDFTVYDNYGKNFVPVSDTSDTKAIEETQKPRYTPLIVDRWGNYRADTTHVLFGSNSVSQKRTGTYRYDPSVWNLKYIQLPSQGEIHVQYDQNQYSYVQNNLSSVLCSLDTIEVKENDIRRVGIDISSSYGGSEEEINRIGNDVVSILDSVYIKKRSMSFINDTSKNYESMLYYKFLFRLNTEHPVELQPLNYENYEYIEGYLSLQKSQYDSVKKRIYLTFDMKDLINKGKQLYENSRNGLAGNKNITPSTALYNQYYRDEDWATTNANMHIFNLSGGIPSKKICRDVILERSQLRLPVPANWSKLGGGIRTKRVLMYDKFDAAIIGANSRLYGAEYIYSDELGNCSGVATNEPSLGREENSLIKIIQSYSKHQEKWEKKLSTYSYGQRDYEQKEGPLGEYLLPASTIGYSSVYQKNIASGLLDTNIRFDGGIVRKQFFTSKDYPMIVKYTPQKKDSSYTPPFTSFYSATINNRMATQGYCFILNNMNGQPKSVETFSGTIYHDNEGKLITKYLNPTPSSKTCYNYYNYLEPLPIYNGNDIQNKYWGVDEEIITEGKFIQEYYSGNKAEVDLEFHNWYPWPISLGWQYSKVVTNFNLHVTNKILRFPAVLKSVITTTDGITQEVENYGFDYNSGRPIFTATSDDFQVKKDTYRHFEYNKINIPASVVVPEMGQSSKQRDTWSDDLIKSSPLIQLWRRIDYNTSKQENDYYLSFAVSTNTPYLKNKVINDTLIIEYLSDSTELNLGNWECIYTQFLKKGDIIKITPHNFDDPNWNIARNFYDQIMKASSAEVYRVIEQKGHIINLQPLTKNSNAVYPNSKMLADIVILKRAKSNQLNEDYASFTTYGSSKHNYLGKIWKYNSCSPEAKLKRQQFTDFLNYALYESSLGPSRSMSQYLASFASAKNIPLQSLNWKFDGLDAYPVTINSTNINDYFELKGSRTEQCIIPNPYKDSVCVYDNYLRIFMFPRDTMNQAVTPLNTLKWNNFDLLTNSVLDSLFVMRLDLVMPEIDWTAYPNGNLPRWLQKKILNAAGYTQVMNTHLFFDYGIQNRSTDGFRKQYKLGYEIFNIDEGSISVICDQSTKKAVVNGALITIKDHNGVDQLQFTFSKNANDQIANIHYTDPSIDNRVFVYGTSIFDVSVKNIFTNDPNGCKFQHTYNNQNSYSMLEANVQGRTIYPLGQIFSKKLLDKDTVTIKLFWSTDYSASGSDYLASNTSDTVYNPLKVFHYDVKENRFYIDSVYGGQEKDRYTENRPVGSNPFEYLEKDVFPRSWFCFDLTALKFNVDLDTTFNYAEFAYKYNNTRLIDGKINLYDDLWSNPENEKTIISNNNDDLYSTGERGKYRVKAEYFYDDDAAGDAFKISAANNNANLFVDSSKYPIYYPIQYPPLESFALLNTHKFTKEKYNPNWFHKMEITKRLSDGRVAEFIDENGLYNSFYYGSPYLKIGSPRNIITKTYDEFTSLVAKNARYNSVLFQSWPSKIYDSFAHTGNSDSSFCQSNTFEVARGLKVNGNDYNLDGNENGKGLVCKIWAKDKNKDTNDCHLKVILDIYDNCLSPAPITGYTFPFNKVCQTGEWSLYEAEIKSPEFYNVLRNIEESHPNTPPIVGIRLTTDRIDLSNIALDDFIIQPMSSSVNAYVYNLRNKRMTASLDQNHLTTYFQYNDIGEADKVLKETMAGLRTVSQSEFNIPSLPRENYEPFIGLNSVKNNRRIDGVFDSRAEGLKKNSVIPGKPLSIDGQQEGVDDLNPSLDDMFFNENLNDKQPDLDYQEKFDLFDLKLSPDGKKIKILGIDKNKDSLSNSSGPSIKEKKNSKGQSLKNRINNLVVPVDSLMETGDKLRSDLKKNYNGINRLADTLQNRANSKNIGKEKLPIFDERSKVKSTYIKTSEITIPVDSLLQSNSQKQIKAGNLIQDSPTKVKKSYRKNK